MKSSFILFFCCVLFSINTFAGLGAKLSLPLELTSKKEFTVFIFMNKNCPCTKQNITYLNSLYELFDNVDFIGIHSLKNTNDSDVQNFAKDNSIPFKIINDHKLEYANLFEANRTPQVFITNNQNEILYIGAITDRTNPDSASNFYLKDALKAIKTTNTLTPREHRSLGCYILR